MRRGENRAAALEMRGDQSRPAARRRRCREPLSGSSSSHKGAPDATTRASVARLRLTGRQQPHRHLGERARPSASIALVDVAAPRSRGRAAAAARGRARAHRRPAPACAAFDPAALRPKQAGGEADQARLAAAVGAGDVQRLARPEREVRPSNSSRPPRPQVTSSNRSSGSHPAASSSACMSSSRQAEMVADLVDQDVRDEMLEAVARSSAHSSRIGRRNRRIRSGSVPDWSTLRSVERHAFVEAGQLERVLDAHRGERLVVGEILDQQHDVAETAGERLGQRVQRTRARSPRSRRPRADGPKRPSWRRGIGASGATRQGCPLRALLLDGPRLPAHVRSGGRVVEGARLESEYTAKPYRGFESLPLRHNAAGNSHFRADMMGIPINAPR